jgi:hypothetical protein
MVAPIIKMGLGPNRSISHPATGLIGPPSDRDNENTKEMEARLTPNPSLTGSKKTTYPLL